MHAHSRLAWLALTPEPERELPYVAATLRAGRGGHRRRAAAPSAAGWSG